MRGPAAVITGASVLSSLGMGQAQLFEEWSAGHTGAGPNSLYDVNNLRCKRIAALPAFDAAALLGARGLKMLDRPTRAVLCATKLALDDARDPLPHYPESRRGVITVSTYCASGNLIQFHREIMVSGPRFVNPLFFSNTMFSTQMMHISIRHKVQGITLCVSSGETSSLDGLLHANRSLADGSASVVIVAGSENLWYELQAYFEQRELLLHGEEAREPRPYDAAGEGTILGEAAVALVLERPEAAQERGAKILASVLGVRNQRGEVAGALESCLRQLFAETGTSPHDVRFIIGAGSGVRSQDEQEARALRAVFGDACPAVTSLKAAAGECLSVSGLMQVVAASQAGAAGRLPPATAGGPAPRFASDLPVVTGAPVAVEGGLVVVTAVGHMGHAAAALLRV